MNTSLQLDHSTTSDRFIPLRRSSSEVFNISNTYPRPLNVSCSDYYINSKLNDSDSGSNYMQLHSKRSRYNNLLIQTLFKNPRRVLYFSPKQKNESSVDVERNDDISWPVKARKEPLISKPEFLFDIPDIQTVPDEPHQKIDWGASGFIATVQGNFIHTNNPDTNSRFDIEFDESLGECIKWDNTGERLAILLKNNKYVSIWDLQTEKVVKMASSSSGKTCCFLYTSKNLITGRSDGKLEIWSHELDIQKTVKSHEDAILTMKISCNENYLVTSSKDGVIKIWCMPSCKELYQIRCDESVTSLDWHPWKESILVIGVSNKKSFCALWNVNEPSNIISTRHSDHPKVDCLTFNPISAELVVSFWVSNFDEENFGQNIVVQRSLEKIVDDINFHQTRTLYLLWDKTGRRLATVGVDENLAIWNFFGGPKKKVRANLFNTESEKIIRSGTIR